MTALHSTMPMLNGRSSMPYAALAAFVLEACFIAALVLSFSDIKMKGSHPQQAVMISFPVVAETPLPKPVQPPPKVIEKLRPKPIHHIVHRPTVHKLATPKPMAVAPASPNILPAPPVAKPSPPTVNPEVMTLFEEQVHTAIQAALQYPYAAQVAHIEGRVQVSFDYIDGRVSAIKIIRASSYAMFNTAAQQAVLGAHYPPPPQNMAGKSLQFTVWVRFDQINSSLP